MMGKIPLLLVEDEFFSQIIFKKITENFNFTADIADTAKKALELVEKIKYQLIFIDLGLPDMTGNDLAKLLKGQAKTKLIAVTAFSAEKIKNECLSNGFDYFIEKPLNEENFLAVIRKFSLDDV
jgi:two-component system aerobic respiration control sensor histidine kinase ArcB